MPVSSFATPITAAPRSATIGSTTSRRSSSPVTELTSGLPLTAFSPSRSAATTDESMQIGTSTTDCTTRMASANSAGSSASGTPAFTSSICAPAATCAIASARTRSKLPSAISFASSLRPVGLIRSPIITNGRPGPMITVCVGDETIVSTNFLQLCSRVGITQTAHR